MVQSNNADRETRITGVQYQHIQQSFKTYSQQNCVNRVKDN